MRYDVVSIMRACLVTLLAVVTAASAHADERDAGVAVTGDESAQEEVAAHVRAWLRDARFAVNATPLSKDATTTLANCFVLDDLGCARGVFEGRGRTGHLVYARVDTAGRNITFTIYWFERGREPISERRTCEQCDGRAWRDLVGAMLRRLVDVPLERPKDRVRPPPPPPRRSRLGPGLLLAGGIATIGVGAVFLYYGSLDTADDKYRYPESTPLGIALLAVGGGATLGGSILLIQAGSSSGGPVASVGANSALLGWTGRF